MWNPCKSVILSSICTKIVIAAVIIFLFIAPDTIDSYIDYTGKNPDILNPLLYIVYSCCIPGLTALFCLDRLLLNIKRGNVFVENNVKYLRLISWCSFAFSIILFISGFYYILFLTIAILAAFFGLIMRVVKNVIEQAVIIKNENDFTI